MINKLFRQAAANLAAHGNIQEKYIDLYAKAMEVALATGINLIVALLIGGFLGMWWHCVILLAAFIPLRSYAGGYHARGYVGCFLESCILLIAVLLCIKYFAVKSIMLSSIWQLFLVSIAVIFFLAPLADENKPISEKEAGFFRKRARIIVVVEAVLVLILTWFQVDYSYSIIMAIVLSAFALVLHKCVESLKSS